MAIRTMLYLMCKHLNVGISECLRKLQRSIALWKYVSDLQQRHFNTIHRVILSFFMSHAEDHSMSNIKQAGTTYWQYLLSPIFWKVSIIKQSINHWFFRSLLNVWYEIIFIQFLLLRQSLQTSNTIYFIHQDLCIRWLSDRDNQLMSIMKRCVFLLGDYIR